MAPAHALRPAGLLMGILAVLELGGCFLAPWSPKRPDSGQISGPPVYVANCGSCHAAVVDGPHAPSTHIAKGIRCGQCHAPAGHPDFTRPVQDGTCGGCHQSEYQQTVVSKHFKDRLQRPLDNDRSARAALRHDGFIAATAGGHAFVGDTSSGALGGRLCAACHYDEHRLGLGAVRRADFCVRCHEGREAHYPVPVAEGMNRCMACHVQVGETMYGQAVNTHRFAAPGSEASAR